MRWDTSVPYFRVLKLRMLQVLENMQVLLRHVVCSMRDSKMAAVWNVYIDFGLTAM
jgi:hypothetical protein